MLGNQHADNGIIPVSVMKCDIARSGRGVIGTVGAESCFLTWYPAGAKGKTRPRNHGTQTTRNNQKIVHALIKPLSIASVINRARLRVAGRLFGKT